MHTDTHMHTLTHTKAFKHACTQCCSGPPTRCAAWPGESEITGQGKQWALRGQHYRDMEICPVSNWSRINDTDCGFESPRGMDTVHITIITWQISTLLADGDELETLELNVYCPGSIHFIFIIVYLKPGWLHLQWFKTGKTANCWTSMLSVN